MTEDKKSILKHLRLACDNLTRDHIVDLKALFDSEEIWESLPVEDRPQWGRVVSQWVKAGLLPLQRAGFNSSRHNLYRKI